MRDYDEIMADARDERPFSNSTQWEVFSAAFCWRDCVKDRNEDCPLIMAAINEKTPTEWTVEDGHVTGCSEFQEGEPDPTAPQTGLPPVRPDGEFVGQTSIFDGLRSVLIDGLLEIAPELHEMASPGGLLSTGSVQTAVSGTWIPPEAPEAIRDMLDEFYRLLNSPEITDPLRPVKLVCGSEFCQRLVTLASGEEQPPIGLDAATLYGMPVEVDEQADPRGWRLVNAYGISIRGGLLDA